MTKWVLAIAMVLSSWVPAYAQTWPDPNAYWTIYINKTAGMEMTDTRWAHEHVNSPDATSVSLSVVIGHQGGTLLDPTAAQLQVRYTAHGVPVSGWLTTFPFAFTLDFSNPALAQVTDGIHDLSVEIQGLPGPGGGADMQHPVKQDFKPYPMFLHIGGRSAPSTMVPVITQNDQEYYEYSNSSGGYVDAATLVPKAYPVDTSVTPWSTTGAPYTADLYQEPMQVHSREFKSLQMLWEEPPGTVNAGLRFVRALAPKFGESYIGLWNFGDQGTDSAFGNHGHRALPVKDGPRGIGWTDGYVQGVVDNDGLLWIVNVSGQLRVMKPDGELITVVGWRVKPDKAPVWVLKPLTSIRMNMEFRGTFTSGGWPDALEPGWHQPMDVALDPNNPNRVYVAAMYDNAIYQVDVNRTTWTGTVSILAGDVNHQAGLVNAVGDLARFNHPFSLIASNDGTKLYVSDHDNDAIRVITLSTKAVTTLYGGPGISERLQTQGVQCATDVRLVCYPASLVKPKLHVSVTAAEATAGTKPDIYFPYFIRVTHDGKLVLFDRGLNTLRVIDPSTNVTKEIANVGDGGFDGGFQRGWVWGDVDKTGHAGMVDGVYWGTGVSYGLPPTETADRFNENYRFTSIDGSVYKFVFGRSWEPDPQHIGKVTATLPPHYPWLMAVDPRGAVIFGGMGDHGLTRLRMRKSTDPDITSDDLVHNDARRVWEYGAPSPMGYYYTFAKNGTNTVVNPPASFFGWGGHNMLGAPDSWSITPTTTDAQIDALFSLSPAITSNPGAHAAVLLFLRQNSGGGSSTPPPPPPDTTLPVVAPNVPSNGVVGTAVTIAATASDNVGVVSGTVTLPGASATAITYPYSSSWTPTAPGAATVAFTATDAAGNTGSANATIMVNSSYGTLTVTTVSCKVRLVGTPPDTTGGWKVQFKRDASIDLAGDNGAPYDQTVTLNQGTYLIYEVWMKSGQDDRRHPNKPYSCQ